MVDLTSNVYADETMVAEFCGRYTRAGSFSSATTPTDDAVKRWINQISGFVNTALATLGFDTPISTDDSEDAYLFMQGVVLDAVVDLCHRANSQGRFVTDKKLQGKSPLSVIRAEVVEAIEGVAAGLENQGVPRSTPFANIQYRKTDDSGNQVDPIFKRDSFGNTFDD